MNKKIRVALLIVLMLILCFQFGWNLREVNILGISLSPHTSTQITYIPHVFFETLNREIRHIDNQSFFGGPLNDYRKIEFFLDAKINSGKTIKVTYKKSSIYVEDEKEKKQIYSGNLGQEFVLFPERKISTDIANLNPIFLRELFEQNPLRRVSILIKVENNIEELESARMRKEIIEIKCKNMAYVEHAYPNASLSDFYPSCLVVKVSQT